MILVLIIKKKKKKGFKSCDDLTGQDTNLFTSNDIDIIFYLYKKEYVLGLETAYVFKNYDSECEYLRNCLNAFTYYMQKNSLNMTTYYYLHMKSPCIDMSAKTVKELYVKFKIFVDGFCNQVIDADKQFY